MSQVQVVNPVSSIQRVFKLSALGVWERMEVIPPPFTLRTVLTLSQKSEVPRAKTCTFEAVRLGKALRCHCLATPS